MDSKETPFSRLIPRLILASQSSGRLQLLEEMGCQVVVKPTYIDETRPLKETPEIVAILAKRKLEGYFEQHSPPLIPLLAADTLIDFKGEIVGKAKTAAEAKIILEKFSNKIHTVYSAYALYLPHLGTTLEGVEATKVTFKPLSEKEIDNYLFGGEWQGAAGAYRIQGEAAPFIDSIEGEISTVVGLPIEAISAILKQLSF